MAKEKAIRPESQHTKTLLETASRIDTRLREAMDSEPVQRRAAQDAAQALFDQRMRSALEEMDIEHIHRAKQGIRVSLLRDAGIQNVYQASRLSFSEICAIDGLGEQSAWKILDTVKQITQNTRDTLQIRIQAENPGQTDDALIRSLYVLIHFRPLRQACALAYRANHAPLQQELQMEVKGRDRGTGLPKTVVVRSEEIREALQDSVNTIVETVHGILEKTPPELASDIAERGIVLTGGGSLLNGLEDIIGQRTGIQTMTAENPACCVAVGTGLYAEVMAAFA